MEELQFSSPIKHQSLQSLSGTSWFHASSSYASSNFSLKSRLGFRSCTCMSKAGFLDKGIAMLQAPFLYSQLKSHLERNACQPTCLLESAAGALLSRNMCLACGGRWRLPVDCILLGSTSRCQGPSLQPKALVHRWVVALSRVHLVAITSFSSCMSTAPTPLPQASLISSYGYLSSAIASTGA